MKSSTVSHHRDAAHRQSAAADVLLKRIDASRPGHSSGESTYDETD